MHIRQIFLLFLLSFGWGGGSVVARFPDLQEHVMKLPDCWQQFITGVTLGKTRARRWHTLNDDEISHRFGYFSSDVRGVKLYVDLASDTEQRPIVLFNIHGTFSKDNPDYFADDYAGFTETKNYAEQLAQRYRAPIELVSFMWSGEDDFLARHKAGQRFASLCNMMYGSLNGYHQEYGMHVIAHSHGCNVTNIASQEVCEPFNTLAYLGSPVVEKTEPTYRPQRFNELYNFFSLNDPVQFAGALNRRSLRKFLMSTNARMYEAQPDRVIFNIRTMIDGASPGHSTIRRVTPQILQVVDSIKQCYHFHSNLVVNIFRNDRRLNGSRSPIVAIQDRLSLKEALANIIDRTAPRKTAASLIQEIELSDYEERQFNSRYRGKSLRYGTLIEWLKENFSEMSDAARAVWYETEQFRNYVWELILGREITQDEAFLDPAKLFSQQVLSE